MLRDTWFDGKPSVPIMGETTPDPEFTVRGRRIKSPMTKLTMTSPSPAGQGTTSFSFANTRGVLVTPMRFYSLASVNPIVAYAASLFLRLG